MEKIILKIILVIAIISMVVGVFQKETQASFLGDIVNNAGDFIETGKKQDPVEQKDVEEIIIPIAQVLMLAANIVLTIVTAIMAIKYMVGNPEDKAKLKTQLIGLVISTIVIFGAQFIWSALYGFFKDF